MFSLQKFGYILTGLTGLTRYFFNFDILMDLIHHDHNFLLGAQI